MTADAPRLDILKALGDNTRYAIYLELARSPQPLATADIAESLGLHVNTVRPHLERMRDVGLLEVQSDNRGCGRPAAAPVPPRRGRALARARAPHLPHPGPNAAAGRRPGRPGPEEAADAGREQGRADGMQVKRRPCLEALVGELDRLGFDPAIAGDDETATIAFAHCPFRELAEAHPDLVCSLHRGLVEGFVDASAPARSRSSTSTRSSTARPARSSWWVAAVAEQGKFVGAFQGGSS